MKRIVYLLFIVFFTFSAFAQVEDDFYKIKVKPGENVTRIINRVIPTDLKGVEQTYKSKLKSLNNLDSDFKLKANQELKLPKRFYGHIIKEDDKGYYYVPEEGVIWTYPHKPALFYYNMKSNGEKFIAQTESFYSGIYKLGNQYLEAVKSVNHEKNQKFNDFKGGDFVRIPQEITVNNIIYQFDFDKKTFVKKGNVEERAEANDQQNETEEKPSSQIALKSDINDSKDTTNIEIKNSKSADDKGVKKFVKPKKELTPPYILFSKFDEVGSYPKKIHYQTKSGGYNFNSANGEGDFLINSANRKLKVEKDVVLKKPIGYNIFYPSAFKEGLYQSSQSLTVRLEKNGVTELSVAKKRPFHIIYVDISNRKTDRNAIVEEIKRIIKSNKEAEVLAFISNGGIPEIIGEAQDRAIEMSKLIYELMPEPANYKKDTDVLFNTIDFNRINFLASELQFHVFMHSKDMGSYDYSFFGADIPHRFQGSGLLNRILLQPVAEENGEETSNKYKTLVNIYADGSRKTKEAKYPIGIKVKLIGLK